MLSPEAPFVGSEQPIYDSGMKLCLKQVSVREVLKVKSADFSENGLSELSTSAACPTSLSEILGHFLQLSFNSGSRLKPHLNVNKHSN